MAQRSWRNFRGLTLKVLNFWKFTSYCSLKPLWSGMAEVVPVHTSLTLHPPSPPTVHQLSRLVLEELIFSCAITAWFRFFFAHALYPLGPVATLRFCHLRPRCVSKQRRTTNVIISDRVWWIWCDAGLATVATRPQRSPHSVASNSRPDYFAATRSRSLFLTINECCVSAAAAAIWEIQWRRSTPQLAPVDTGGQGYDEIHDYIYLRPSDSMLYFIEITQQSCRRCAEKVKWLLRNDFQGHYQGHSKNQEWTTTYCVDH